MRRDQEIFDLIEQEHQRQLRGMELIASENFVSDEVMSAMGSYLTNKYAEGYPGKRYYGGCQVVDKVETLAIERVKKLFDAEYANVQPHSGAQANQAVLLAVLKPGDTFMGLDLDQGGHLSHGSEVNTSGILYNHIGYTLNKETGRVDYDEMERLALEHKPKLIIGGGSAYSREWDYERMRKIADEVGALLMIDMAHPAGLIAAGLLKNPLKYAHIVTTTTHKTLRGPRGGVILLGKDFANPWGLTTKKGEVKPMSMLFNSAVFPGNQGGVVLSVAAAIHIDAHGALGKNFAIRDLRGDEVPRIGILQFIIIIRLTGNFVIIFGNVPEQSVQFRTDPLDHITALTAGNQIAVVVHSPEEISLLLLVPGSGIKDNTGSVLIFFAPSSPKTRLKAFVSIWSLRCVDVPWALM